MTQFTPGPWAQFLDREAGEIDIFPAGRRGTIATVNIREGEEDRFEADAGLLMAAPDLYAALVVAAKILARVGQNDDEAWAAFSQCVYALGKAVPQRTVGDVPD